MIIVILMIVAVISFITHESSILLVKIIGMSVISLLAFVVISLMREENNDENEK